MKKKEKKKEHSESVQHTSGTNDYIWMRGLVTKEPFTIQLVTEFT